MRARRACALGALVLAVAGCTTDGADRSTWGPDRSSAAPPATPLPRAEDFAAAVDNRYLPLHPGSVWVYESKGSLGDARITVRVLPEARVVAGVRTTVVQDTVRFHDGNRVERTMHWFAQDTDGNVWRLGRHAVRRASAEPAGARSWRTGRAGAEAGIAMLGDPEPGTAYREGFAPERVEEDGLVLSTDADVTVAAGTFLSTVKIARSTPFEPGQVVHEYYAPGVGLVYREVAAGGDQRTWLVALRIPPVVSA